MLFHKRFTGMVAQMGQFMAHDLVLTGIASRKFMLMKMFEPCPEALRILYSHVAISPCTSAVWTWLCSSSFRTYKIHMALYTTDRWLAILRPFQQVFQLHHDDERMIREGCVQWNPVYC